MNTDGGDRSRAASFRDAFRGWGYLLRNERNAQIHAAMTALVIALCGWLRLKLMDWTFIAFALGLVWATEAMNTALEAISDLASPEFHPLARAGKDLGAAAVLIASLTAAIIGFLVIGPPLWQKIFGS